MRFRGTRAALTLLVLAAVAALAAGGSAQAAGKIALSQGIGSAALPTAPFGDTDPSTPEQVSFILRAQNLDELKAHVLGGMPGGYLTVKQFAARYGQPSAVVILIQRYLQAFGISTRTLPDNLVIKASGTAGQFDKALGILQQNYRLPAVPAHDGHPGRPAMVVHGTHQSPRVPSSVGGPILAVLGLTNYPTAGADSARIPAAVSHGEQDGTLVPADFASQYDLTPLYDRGATGAHTTVGIVTLASMDPQVAESFWSDVLGIPTLPNRITQVDVDGGSGPISEAAGSGESTLDVEQSGAVAPDAKIVVYQAPNTDVGFVDGWFQAAADNVADTVSASWGSSETVIEDAVNSGQESAGYAASFDEAFLELAAQGQTAFTSSGDSGAYPAILDEGSTNLDGGSPDSSPYITTAGGTTLPGTIPLAPGVTATIPAERTWGWDWLWPYGASLTGLSEEAFAEQFGIAGSGGGFSTLEATPSYQQGVRGTQSYSGVPYLTPIDFQPVDGLNLPTDWSFDPNPHVIRGNSSGRATPDLSANGDPFTGYIELFTFGDQDPSIQSGWGGTSFVAPQFNGVAAVMDSLFGKRLGFWNPSIYRFAQQSGSPFTPLDASGTQNDNLFYTGTRGNLFNAGSGLGTPDFAKLATAFAIGRR